MKTQLTLITLLAALLATGCSSLSVLPGHDPVLVNAQRLEKSGLATMKEFLHWERVNYPLLQGDVKRGIHEIAEQVRRDGMRYLDDIDAARLAYKANRTPENKATLNAATAAFTVLLDRAAIEYAKAKGIQQ